MSATTGAVAEALGVDADTLLQRSIRVRSVDRVPFSYLTTHVPENVAVTFTKQELASRPLLELLERAGVKVENARQRIGAGLATPDVAQALDIRAGSPLIELVRVVFDQSGRRSSICTPFIGRTAMRSKWIWCAQGRAASKPGRRSWPGMARAEALLRDPPP